LRTCIESQLQSNALSLRLKVQNLCGDKRFL
jgi:hypothetical protein